VMYTYQGQDDPVYQVPIQNGIRDLALVTARPLYSEFVDPHNPNAGLIHWVGSWRTLQSVYRLHLSLSNFSYLWGLIDFPLAVKNTVLIAIIGEVGVLCSSIAVAYGFSRFRIPGGRWLFYLLIATIIIPDSITLVPVYYLNVRVLQWNGTWLPMLVPQFFGNAIFIFLLRQNFKSIPRELDEAAMIDGASPQRILVSIILPQCVPVVVTVALLHFFYVWNELRMSSLYLGISPSLWPISFTVQTYQTYGFTPEILETSALLLLVVPIVVLLLAQRFFLQDMVVTGLEK
jgi:multiple sugar transport system permease protein